MTRRASLDRLRDISKQRTIRRPIQPDGEHPDHGSEIQLATIEWPVPSSDRS